MRVVTLTTETKYSWTTNANGTDAEICRYFLGNTFDVGTYPVEQMERCVECTIDGTTYTLRDQDHDRANQ